jgi:hypothetical protein
MYFDKSSPFAMAFGITMGNQTSKGGKIARKFG